MKTLTYWSRQCLTCPPPRGCTWTKCGTIFDAIPPTSDVLNSGVTEPNLTKISHKAENWWPINTLKSEFQYSNSWMDDDRQIEAEFKSKSNQNLFIITVKHKTERLNVTTGWRGEKLPHLLASNKKKNIKPSISFKWVAVQFLFVSLFSAKTTGPIFTKILHDIVTLSAIKSYIYKALVHSVSERQSNEWRWSIFIYR